MRRRRFLASSASLASFAFAALSALVGAACNQILGSENAGSVVPDDASAGIGNDGGRDGAGADSDSLGDDAGSFDARAPDGGCVTPYTNCADGGALADCHDLANDAKSCGVCGNACAGVCEIGRAHV